MTFPAARASAKAGITISWAATCPLGPGGGAGDPGLLLEPTPRIPHRQGIDQPPPLDLGQQVGLVGIETGALLLQRHRRQFEVPQALAPIRVRELPIIVGIGRERIEHQYPTYSGGVTAKPVSVARDLRHDSRVTFEWTTEVEQGAWVAAGVHGFARDVGSVIPHGFEAYARIFHPIEQGPDRRWADLAARNGRIAHPEMQYHAIAQPVVGGEGRFDELNDLSVGSLPRPELDALARAVEPHTTTPASCWFAVWEGFGHLQGGAAVSRLTRRRWPFGWRRGAPEEPALVPAEVMDGPRLELVSRAYLLLHGGVTDVAEVEELLHDQSPNLWWPDDRAWCVATEIDFGWTYVGGSEALIDAVLSDPELEALPAQLTDGATYDSDLLNAPIADG